MAAGSLNPLNMQAYAIDPHPRPDGGIEAFKVDFDGIGGMFVAFAIKWSGDPCFSQVFGFPLIVFEDDAVNGIIGSANGGAGMWNQSSDPSTPGAPTWQQLMDSEQGQLAVNGAFQAAIKKLSIHNIEVSTDVDYFHGMLISEIQHFRNTYVGPMVDPGPPPGRVPPWVLFPPAAVGVLVTGEGVVAAQASRLTITYGQIGAVPVP